MVDDLKPYDAELKLSRRWFETARECAINGKVHAAQHCLERGLAILDRVEAAMLERRANHDNRHE